MKKTTGFLLLAAFSIVTTMTALHGCGTNPAAAPAAPAAPAKFTIVGSGN